MGQHLLNTRIFRGLCECGRQGSAHMEEEVEVRSISIISLVSSKIEQLKAILSVDKVAFRPLVQVKMSTWQTHGI